MICRKCGNEWFVQKVPIPKDINCPNCGAQIYKDGKYVEATTEEIGMNKESVDKLLEIVDSHLDHHGKQSPTHYLRGYIKGVEWTKTEIMKVFER